MTIEVAAIQATAMTDDIFRHAMSSLVRASSGTSDTASLAVTANGTPNMSVNVAAGSAWIAASSGSGTGSYFVRSSATENKTIAAADGSLARIDIVVLTVRDAEFAGANNDAILQVVTGTPASTPAAPAVPDNSLLLATVAVAAGATTITTGNITDGRVRAGAMLAPDQVTATEIAAGAVGTSELATSAVTTTRIAPNAVTGGATGKLATGTVQPVNLGSDMVRKVLGKSTTLQSGSASDGQLRQLRTHSIPADVGRGDYDVLLLTQIAWYSAGSPILDVVWDRHPTSDSLQSISVWQGKVFYDGGNGTGAGHFSNLMAFTTLPESGGPWTYRLQVTPSGASVTFENIYSLVIDID